MNLCFFESFGELYVTNEFKELLAKEKFEFFSTQDDYFIYTNKEKNLLLALRWVLAEMGDFTVDFQLQPLPKDISSEKYSGFSKIKKNLI